MKMDDEAVRKQSESAYKQWSKQWREQSKYHSKHAMKSWDVFENIGIGKPVVCVANGWSTELEIETLKANQGNVDILCCDKSLGHTGYNHRSTTTGSAQLVKGEYNPNHCAE